MSKIDDIAEMICMANGERLEKLPIDRQSTVKVYAQSIINYMKVPDNKASGGWDKIVT